MAQNMMLYWGSGSPPCWRVMIALEEKMLQGYNHKLLSFDKNEHKCEEVKALNPRAQLPTFKHGDIVVNESFAACLYLESAFKSQGTRLIPDDPVEQALVYQRMLETNNLQQKLYYVAFYDYYVPEGERHESALKRNKESLIDELKLWDGYLEKVVGLKHSLVDERLFSRVVWDQTGALRLKCALESKNTPLSHQSGICSVWIYYFTTK